MDKVKEIYKEAWKEFGNSPNAVCWPKGRQDLRFDKLIAHFPGTTGTVADFGCGLAHFLDYSSAKKLGYKYTGVEMVEEFLGDCRKRFPGIPFLTTSEFENSPEKFDYIICSGTFNIKYHDDPETNDRFFKEMISKLFQKCSICLSLNLMTDQVDFQQAGAWHVNPGGFLAYLRTNLSRRFVIDSSYMPYEYTVTIFKDDVIKRPENVFNV